MFWSNLIYPFISLYILKIQNVTPNLNPNPIYTLFTYVSYVHIFVAYVYNVHAFTFIYINCMLYVEMLGKTLFGWYRFFPQKQFFSNISFTTRFFLFILINFLFSFQVGIFFLIIIFINVELPIKMSDLISYFIFYPPTHHYTYTMCQTIHSIHTDTISHNTVFLCNLTFYNHSWVHSLLWNYKMLSGVSRLIGYEKEKVKEKDNADEEDPSYNTYRYIVNDMYTSHLVKMISYNRVWYIPCLVYVSVWNSIQNV